MKVGMVFLLTHLFPRRRFHARPLDGFYTGPSPDVLSGCLMGEHSNRNRHGQKSKPRGPLGRKAGDRWDCKGLPQDIAEEWDSPMKPFAPIYFPFPEPNKMSIKGFGHENY